MPTKTGTVRCLQISSGSAFTTIQDAAGGRETFILWFDPRIPAHRDAFTRVLHSMWVALLRDAIANNTTVSVSHPTGSAEILHVQLGV